MFGTWGCGGVALFRVGKGLAVLAFGCIITFLEFG